MKILLAPSETKLNYGDGKTFCKNNFSFPGFYDKRLEVFEHYESFINSCNIEELSKWFGLKNLKECKRYSESLKNKPTIKAIQRYTGVAFEAIAYNSLKQSEQAFIDKNVLIFSNLFGVLKSSDMIPDYKYKQGAKMIRFDIEKFYKSHLKNLLDDYIGDEILDLRSNYYNKYYVPNVPFITYKFLKNSKSISHWAKYYRGLVVRTIAQNDINSFKDILDMKINGLKFNGIEYNKKEKIIIMEIEN